tara:strand:- start:3181 stop:3384 length:204 start_codon:yes stop_codon:yes gene_type:complete
MTIESEAKEHMERKQRLFYEGLLRKLEPVKQHINEYLPNSKNKDRALERVDDVSMIAKYTAELHGLK